MLSSWNSDCFENKKSIVRVCDDDGSSDSTRRTHDSFPVHGLGKQDGYFAEVARRNGAADDDDDERSSECASNFSGRMEPHQRVETAMNFDEDCMINLITYFVLSGQFVEKVNNGAEMEISRGVQEGLSQKIAESSEKARTHGRKLVLRPYGYPYHNMRSTYTANCLAERLRADAASLKGPTTVNGEERSCPDDTTVPKTKKPRHGPPETDNATLRAVPDPETQAHAAAQIEVGECVTELDHLCPKLDNDPNFFKKDVEPVVLHRESDVDVRVIETGRFGKVVQKTYLEQTMRFPHRGHANLQEQLLYEASILKSLRGRKGMLQLLGWCHSNAEPRSKSLVYEYVAGNYTPTQTGEIFAYMQQLLQALDYLHRQEIVHCNVKRENVLFDASQTLTLIDFETAVHGFELIDMGNELYQPEAAVFYPSNPFFSAPEVLEPQRGVNKHGKGKRILYGHRRDVYGAGLIFAELLMRMDEKTHVLDVHAVDFPWTRRHTCWSKIHVTRRSSGQEWCRGDVVRLCRDERLEQRRKFSDGLGGAGGSMRAAYRGLKRWEEERPGRKHEACPSICSRGGATTLARATKFNLHGADLVKHMTLFSRFERARAWEALAHSFFRDVDPEDLEEEPEFETMRPQHQFETIDEDEPLDCNKLFEYLGFVRVNLADLNMQHTDYVDAKTFAMHFPRHAMNFRKPGRRKREGAGKRSIAVN